VKPSTRTRGVTITVALGSPPSKAMLARFTAQTGIRVNWVQLDWDSLQTKISTASMSKTYFADATDVDWSRVGQLHVTDWFYPLGKYLDTKQFAADMPQLGSFTVDGKVIGVPYDTSFMVTTVNRKLFAKAGITTMPTTMADYTKDLQQIKQRGVVKYPLNIPFAAAEGLSTYWYQTTEAFGGQVLNKDYVPQFTSPDSAGYRAMQWMVSAMKDGLVSPGNLNVTDSQGQQTLMAKGAAASTLGDYSGNVGTLYDVKSSSSVTGQVGYIRTPGRHGPAGNVNNPDGIGIPRTAKYPNAAAKFIKWFIDPDNQAAFAGLDGPKNAITGFPFPARLSTLKRMNEGGKIAQGGQILKLLTDGARPAFPGAQPPWYGQFSNAVYTHIHSAAAGQESVPDAVSAIASTVTRLKGQA
ncbi:MAG TPA: extracellular solute-binding protein, partial [Mycobacteriales bacterium]|nr:extracellular solute-binding protein [Mycobacteriales bacterium]